MVTGVAIAVTFNDYARAVNFFTFGRKKVDGHFRPLGDGLIRAEFDAVLADFDGFGRKRQPSLGVVHVEALKDAGPVEFASAHIG